MGKFPESSVRSSHYVDHAQGRKHDAGIANLERAHKRHHDLGMNTEPDQQSHNPDQENFEHSHPDQVSPTIPDGGSSPLKGL
jgi:hypothetical protein